MECDEDYDYQFSLGEGIDVKQYITSFTNEEYQKYFDYCREQNISVSDNMALYKVTVPPTGGEALNVNVETQKAKAYTILYQPDNTAASEVWCKFTKRSGDSSDKPFAIQMSSDSALNGLSVWSAKFTAAFELSGIGFANSKDSLENTSTSETVTYKQSAQDSDWTSITGGKYLVIGGNARTAVAVFVSEKNAVTVYDKDSITLEAATIDGGVTYEIAVCQTDEAGTVAKAGTVKAPSAEKEGYRVQHWRTIEDKAEKTYLPGETITIKENTTLNAVWQKITPVVKLNLDGGTGDDADKTLNYGDKLSFTEPVKDGYAFAGWTVAKSVVQNGRVYAEGTRFDLDTPITADLELTAQWKHVHPYGRYQISDFGDDLKEYEDRAPYLHVKWCSKCLEAVLEAHSFDVNGTCACGYQKPGTENAKVEISYGLWSGGQYTPFMSNPDRTVRKQTATFFFAPDSFDTDMKFSKWQYSTDEGKTWMDLAYSAGIASFTVSCDVKLRALYTNAISKPEISLSVRTYTTEVSNEEGQFYADTLKFHADYKLPEGYTFVDAGIKVSDNDGMIYYEIKEYKESAGEQAALIGEDVAAHLVILDFNGALSAIFKGAFDAATSKPKRYYDYREDSVLNTMSAAELSEHMLNIKPITVEKYPMRIYTRTIKTTAQFGSFDMIAPVELAQWNVGNHYVYGMAYLQYKDRNGTLHTIYTDAIAATLQNIDSLSQSEKVKTKQGS